jgi:zinc/manganese transport system permease protein
MMIHPFADPAMKHALAGALLVSISGAPLGVMLVLRRMSLMGDVIAHAILPGTAAGFIVAGMSNAAMSLGGLIAGLLVALMAGLATRFTAMREDAGLVSSYLIAVAIGILLLALHGSAQDLEDILFGNAEAIDAHMLYLMAAVTSVTLLILAVIYRPLVVESFDPVFMRSVRGRGGFYHVLFMMLVVLNMVEGYRALGTLMASGLLIIPAVVVQFWMRSLSAQMLLAIAIACVSSLLGLLIACVAKVPSGPPIILTIGAIYFFSFMFGRYGSVRARYFPFRHLEN